MRAAFIVGLAALATTLAAVGGWRYARASAPINGPIVVVSIDTLRADHLPIYGYRKIATPSIDALAADGVVFDRAYTHSPQTLPAHVALLSGRLPFENGVRDDGFAASRNIRFLQQLLRDRGYTTGGVVSTPLLGRDTGIDRGFDFYDAAPRDGAESEAIAERWLGAAATSRLFLFLHLNEPHKPYAPPDRFSTLAPYDGEIAYADELVGRLLKYLKAHQLYDRSTIVLLSDHGEGLGDHGEQEHGLFLYEEVVRVPLIVKQPAGVGAGRRIGDVVQHIDLVPTVLDLVKAPAPDGLRGRSLRPLLDATGGIPEQPVYAEALYGERHFGWSALTALTDGRYQYISAPREELYDLRRDSRERQNVLADRIAVSRTLKAALDRMLADSKPGQQKLSETDAPDPKDKYQVLETYREAAGLAAERKWAPAIRLLQGIVNDDDGVAEAWKRLASYAMRIERYDQAAGAYARIAALEPQNVDAHLGAALALLKWRKLDEARDRAELAAQLAGESNAAAPASNRGNRASRSSVSCPPMLPPNA